MSQISFLNDFCLDPCSNAQMKRRYLRHKNRIEEISKKSLHYDSMEHQQQRIINVVHKSKELSRKFQLHEFQLRKSIQNKRMINHLSRFQVRKHSVIQQSEEVLTNKKIKSNAKQQILRQFQINLENKCMNEHLQQYSVNKKKFRKKVKQEVEQYEKLRLHMQKFKNSNSTDSGVSGKKIKSISNRPNVRSRKTIQPTFFKEENPMTPVDLKISKSRSLPPLQLMIV